MTGDREAWESTTADDEATARDLDAYKQVVALWASENPIKTTKLQWFLATNGLLAAALALNHGLTRENLPVYVAGAALSFVWTISIGRTVLFQKAWQAKWRALAAKHPLDPRFHAADVDESASGAGAFLRFVGGVPSKVYLLGAPIAFTAFWLAAIVANLRG